MRHPDHPTLAQAARIWAKIGLLSFGGPAGQIAVMHRILVEERRWLGEARFLQALNYCMLLPGPEAQQLTVYVGWLMHRLPGGLVAGALFVAPGLVSIMALSWIYAIWGSVGAVAALFFGLKAAVLAVIVQAVARIGRRVLGRPPLLAIAALSFVAIFALGVPFPAIILAAGAAGWLGARAGWPGFGPGGGHAPMGHVADADTLLGEGTPDHARIDGARAARLALVIGALWLGPVAGLALWLGPEHVMSRIGGFFSVMAVVTFGGAYAVLAYVAQEAVQNFGWLAPSEMLDGLGMAETTPGPLIMVTQFVGFMAAFRDPGALPPLLAGSLGGLLTTWVTFAPCFLWIFLGAPFIERLRHNAGIGAALSAITAAVVGVIANLALWFALHTLFADLRPAGPSWLVFDVPVWSSLDPAAAGLAVVALVAVLRFGFGTLAVLAGCALAGLALHAAGLRG